MRKFAKLTLMAVSALLALTSFAAADSPGSHPAYLHALSDLRNARAILYYTSNARVNADEQRAVDEIDAAIHAVTEAAIDDGKPMSVRPPADIRWSRTDRLNHALELLDQAKADVKEHESNSWSGQLKDRALHHIDTARKAVRHAIKTEGQE